MKIDINELNFLVRSLEHNAKFNISCADLQPRIQTRIDMIETQLTEAQSELKAAKRKLKKLQGKQNDNPTPLDL